MLDYVACKEKRNKLKKQIKLYYFTYFNMIL